MLLDARIVCGIGDQYCATGLGDGTDQPFAHFEGFWIEDFAML